MVDLIRGSLVVAWIMLPIVYLWYCRIVVTLHADKSELGKNASSDY